MQFHTKAVPTRLLPPPWAFGAAFQQLPIHRLADALPVPPNAGAQRQIDQFSKPGHKRQGCCDGELLGSPLARLRIGKPVHYRTERPAVTPNQEGMMLALPQRQGVKPKTHYGLPHEQLDQNPPTRIYTALKERAFDLPFVERRPSIISVPGTEALWLQDEGGHGCTEAFMRGNEFAHVHPPYDGSMHMMLPEREVAEVLRKGWGEAHPLALEGRMPATLVMVFGPRDQQELDVILTLIDTSYQFARGL